MQKKTTSVYSRSNAWRFSQELTELYPLRYLYHEGDVVYIGADKYEVGVDFMLRGRHAFQIVGVMVFLFGIEVAVILNQLPQPFFRFRCGDFADMPADLMEQALQHPDNVQELLDFLSLVQKKTTSVYSSR